MTISKALATGCGLTLLISGCAAPVGPLARSTSEPSAPTAVRVDVPMILPTPAAVSPLDERQLVRFDIRYADELAYAQGFIWVKTSDGRVVKVDPTSNTVAGEVKVDTTPDIEHHCMGLGTDAKLIWACSASGDFDVRTINVVAIDPQGLEVVATLEVDKVWDQISLPFVDGRIWVLSDTGVSLVGIDTITYAPGPPIELGARCVNLAAAGEALIAVCPLDDLVLRVDPRSGTITARADLPEPRGVFADAQGVWVLQESTVVRLDPVSLAAVAAFTHLPSVGLYGGLAVMDGAVWVRQRGGFLYRIDPSTNVVSEQIAALQALDGGSVLATPDSVWTTANEDHLLFRLSLQ